MKNTPIVLTTLLTGLLLWTSQPASAASRSLDPLPSDSGSLLAQLKRFKGQTSFLNIHRAYPYGAPEGAPLPKAGRAAADGRAIQESDVFMVGKPGSKLLYLLNDYRGLQVVSYADGPTEPRLIGRAQPTGNYPDTLYGDLDHDRLLVLENDWQDYSGQASARLLTYDVRDPADPKLAAQFELEGSIADSRMVGDVLYVATTVPPRDGAKGQGLVYSFKLARKGPVAIEKRALSLPVSRRENMNILEVTEGSATRYYLVAVLSESGWGWWDRSNLVEVVDISDPNGRIEPVMAVSSKGAIAERTQTFIRNRTLVVVSNYQNGENESAGPRRIAVEAFKFPAASPMARDEVITDFEANFRKMHIERSLQDLYGEERETRYRQLIADPALGLQGRFIAADGTLRKLVADHIVTVGDGSGLHASLRDVRVEGSLLYVFWVPQNEIDPFDLFDISAPEKGIRYLKRLQFEGWIDRAVPLAFEGHRYVLGLGWIVDPVNNETRRRSPQVKLFEILPGRTPGGTPRSVEIADLTLTSAQGWIDFNGRDRNIEVRMDGHGKGTVLFPVQGYAAESGGKLISFDLAAAAEGRAGAVFRDGAFLAGDASWLKRVFTNPEISRISSFSNETLGTFELGALHGSEGIVRAVHLLELARSIDAYIDLPQPDGTALGLQLISGKGSHAKPQTVLRTVQAERADSERPEALSELAIEGRYLTHAALAGGTMPRVFVATEQCSTRCEYMISEVRVGRGSTLAIASAVRLQPQAPGEASGFRSIAVPYWRPYFQLTALPSGELLATSGNRIHLIRADEGQLTATPLEIGSCLAGASGGESGRGTLEAKLLNGQLYFTVEEPVTISGLPETPGGHLPYVSFTRNWLIPARLDGARASCGQKVNIPGTPVLQLADGGLITREERLLDMTDYSVTTQSLSSLQMTRAGHAVLRDDYELGRDFHGELSLLGRSLSFLKTTEAGGYRPGYVYGGPGGQQLWTTLGVDTDGTFTQTVVGLAGDWIANARIRWSSESGQLVLLSNGREFQVADLSSGERPVLRKVALLDPRFRELPPQTSVKLPGWYSSAEPSFATGRFAIPNGLFGVVQFRVLAP